MAGYGRCVIFLGLSYGKELMVPLGALPLLLEHPEEHILDLMDIYSLFSRVSEGKALLSAFKTLVEVCALLRISTDLI